MHALSLSILYEEVLVVNITRYIAVYVVALSGLPPIAFVALDRSPTVASSATLSQ